MTINDHLFILLFVVVHPIAGYISYRRLLRRVAAGESLNPAHLYRTTAIGQWVLFALLLATWLYAGRSWAALGFGWSMHAGFYAGVALTVAVIALVARQLAQVTNADPEKRKSLRDQLGKLEVMMPRNPGDLRNFYGLSLTAGIVEEALWRGFLFWYLGHFMPLWTAALVSAIGFGIAHLYQGIANVPRIVVVGGVFAALYLITGSLWLPMILHAVFDMLQGRTVYELLRARGA